MNQHELFHYYLQVQDRKPYGICFECGTDEHLHNHHVVPTVRGGTKTIPLCGDCHGKVHGKNFGSNWRKLQKEGIAKARSNGSYFGRVSGSVEPRGKFLSKPKNKKIAKLLDENMSITHIARIMGCSRNLVMKVRDKRAPTQTDDTQVLRKFIFKISTFFHKGSKGIKKA
jgi:hypothetical protein